MRFMIRQINEQAKLTDEIVLDALEAAVPHAVVKAVVADLGVATHRRRKLPAELGLLLSVVMNPFTQDSLDQVLVKLLKGLRFLWPDPTFVPASKGAICQARYRLGAHPTVAPFIGSATRWRWPTPQRPSCMGCGSWRSTAPLKRL